MSEHTKEPWAVCTEAPNDYWYVGRSIESLPIGSKIADTCVLDANAKENARRIVACVNSCADIPTDWLEQNEIAPHVATCGLNQHEAEKERDELRTKLAQAEAALKQHRDAFELLYEVYKCLLDVRNASGYEKTMIRNDFLNKAIDVIDGGKLAKLSAIQPSQEALDAYVISRLENFGYFFEFDDGKTSFRELKEYNDSGFYGQIPVYKTVTRLFILKDK